MGTVLRFTFLSLALLCGAAQAQLAYTAKTVNLRAGPARDFPVVAVLPAGFQIAVQGCVGDYTWCDVLAGDLRGWVYGGNIQYSYQNSYAPVITWGPVMGIAIIGFTLEDYWGRHYWRSPWYPERHRWADRQWPAPRPHVRPHQPPAPVPPGGGPPPPAPPPPPPLGPPPPPPPPAPRGGAPPPAPPPPDGRPVHPGRPDGTAPLRPQPPGRPPPGQRPPGVAPGTPHPGGAPVPQPRPYVAPGTHRPPGVAQPQPQPPGPRGGGRPRTLPDNSGRGQPQYP